MQLSDYSFAKIFKLIGLLFFVSVALVIIYCFLQIPYLALQSWVNKSKQAVYESAHWSQDVNAQICFALHSGKLPVMLSKRNVEFIEFTIDKNQPQSTIDKSLMTTLNLSWGDLDYVYQNSILIKSFLPVMTMQDLNGTDFVVRDFRLVLADKNILGKDFLDLFNYSLDLDSSRFMVELSPEEKFLLSKLTDLKLSEANLNYQKYVVRLMHQLWVKAVVEAPSELLQQLTVYNQPFENEIELEIDLTNGYIKNLVLLKASDNAVFNEFCKQFVRERVPRLKRPPAELLHETKLLKIHTKLIIENIYK